MIASLSLDKNSVVQVGFGKSDAWHEASLCIKLDGLLHNCTVDMLLFTFSASHQDNPLSDFGFLPSLVKWSNFFFFFSFFFEIKHLAFTHWTRRDYTKCIRKEVALKISCLGLVLPYLAIIQKMSNHIFWALFDCCELVACIFKWMLKVEEKNGSFLVWDARNVFFFSKFQLVHVFSSLLHRLYGNIIWKATILQTQSCLNLSGNIRQGVVLFQINWLLKFNW